MSSSTVTTTKPDFTEVSNLAVTFSAGETQKTVTLGVLDDDIPERDEQFVLFVAEHDGIDESGGHTLITILDNDVVGKCEVV